MKALLWCAAEVLLCAVVIGVAAELLAARTDESIRACMYAGGAGGGLLALAGLPFAVILSRIRGGDAQNDARFWTWWGSGLLVRLALLGALAFALHGWCAPQHYTAASMTMMAVYLVGMFTEVGWLATILSKSDGQTTAKKA